MPGRSDAIQATTEDRGGRVASNAPPQRDTTELQYSDDLGGVVDPHDSDLIRGGGWSSWSASERLSVLGAFLVVASIVAAIIIAVVL